MDLSHLRSTIKSETNNKHEESYEIMRNPPPAKEERMEVERLTRKYYPPFLSVNDEKVYLRQLESSVSENLFEQLVKLLEVYQQGIISKD